MNQEIGVTSLARNGRFGNSHAFLGVFFFIPTPDLDREKKVRQAMKDAKVSHAEVVEFRQAQKGSPRCGMV